MKQMAIMKNVGFGCRDCGYPVLWFTAYISESIASLQILGFDKALAILKKHNISDIKDLEGKPCWVESNGTSSEFIDLCVIK